MKKTIQVLFTALTLLFFTNNLSNAQSILFDNGPFYNSAGTGSGGANESVLYTTTFGMGTIGFGHQQTAFNRIADDFTITDCKWKIDSIVFFGYQTGSTTTSTFTGVTFRIWDSIPTEAAPFNVVYGDTTTNAMIRTVWSGAYRVTETTSGNSARPIMRNTCIVNSLILNTGTYWIDWASSGSLASGPWAPARTPVGMSITGNGRQRVGAIWNNAVDGGTGTPAQGFPFIIYGSAFNANADAGTDQNECVGNSVMLGGSPSGTGTGPLMYAWNSAPDISDTTLANPLLNVNGSGSYVLTVQDSIGCIDLDTITVNAIPLPDATITPAGSTSFCPGDSVTLSGVVAMGYEYLWNTLDTTSSISATMNTNYILDVTDSSGCVNSDTISITIYPLPVANISPGGTSSICPGTNITLTADAGVSYNYTWSTTETTQSINVSTAGVIAVNVVDSVGCTASDSVTITISPSPDVTVTQVGANLSSNQAGASYQWIDCDNGNAPIGGATSQNYTATANGNYAVIVDLGGCADTSACNLVFGFGVENETGITAKVFPNPSSEVFYLELNDAANANYTIYVHNTLGQLVQTKQTISENSVISINCSEWEPGVYLITGMNTTTHKEFKQRIVVQ